MPITIPGFSSYSSFFSLFTPLKENNNAQHQFAFPVDEHVEMETEWFDAQEYPDELIPVTEDARRCMRQLISEFGQIKQNELVFRTLMGCFPSFPLEVINAAYSLYTAAIHGRDIDFAVLNTLGLTSSYLLDDGNMIARLAQYLRDTISDTLSAYVMNTFHSDSSNYSCDHFFSALAVLAITAKYYWRHDNNQPQRSVFRIPAFLGHILLRASVYWNQMEHIARNAAQSCDIQVFGEPDIHCVMSQHREQVSARISNQQSWLCTQGHGSDSFRLKPAATCNFTYTPSELRELREKGVITASRVLQAERPEANRNEAAAIRDEGGEPVTPGIYYDAPGQTPVPLASAGTEDSTFEMAALMLPAAIVALEVQAPTPGGGIGRGVKIAGALGSAALMVTTGGILIRLLYSSGKTASSATAHTYAPGTDALPANASAIIHVSPSQLPQPVAAALHVDDSWVPPELRSRLADEQEASAPDDAKITKKFHFECATQLDFDTSTWSAIFRQIGNALKNPVQTVKVKGAIYSQLYLDRAECPSEYHLRDIEEWASKYNEYVSFIIGMLPFSTPFVVAQTIIGPSLNLMSDYLAGRKPDPIEKYMIFAQLITMAAQTIPTMSHSEIVSVYNLEPEENLHNDLLGKRFIPEEGTIKVRVDGKKYPYNALNNKMSYVSKDGELQPIRYNHVHERWETVNGKEYRRTFATTEKNKQLYGLPLDEVVTAGAIPVHKSNSPGGLPILTRKDKLQGDFVMLGHSAVSVEYYTVQGKTVTVASSVDLSEKAVLLNTHYGWESEPSEVAMDDDLRLFLESYGSGSAITLQHRLSEILPDGFCQNDEGELFLKHDNRYHKVEKKSDEEAWRLIDHPGSRIIRQDGMFRLTEADDMLFSTDIQPIGVNSLETEGQHVFIEGAAQKLLLKEGVTLDSATPHSRVAPGVYQDEGAENTLFTVQDGDRAVNFKVIRYNDREVSIPLRGDEKSSIDLWLEGDIWIRVRKTADPKRDNYVDKLTIVCPSQRNRRQLPLPQDKGCQMTMIEKSLDAVLEMLCMSGGAVGKVPGVKLSTVLWKDMELYLDESTLGANKQKYYFKYDGPQGSSHEEYFIEAEPNDGVNCRTGVSCLRLFSTRERPYSRRRNMVADIVVEKKTDNDITRSEFKTRDTALAEHTGISQQVAANFLLKTESVTRISDAIILIHIIREVAKRPEMYVAPIRDISLPERPPEYHLYLDLEKRLYPDRIYNDLGYQAWVFDFTAKRRIPGSVKDTQLIIKQHIDYVRNFILMWARRANGYAANEAEQYFSSILKTPIHFHSPVFRAVDERLQALNSYLVPDNIKLVKGLYHGWSDDTVLTASEINMVDAVYFNPIDNKLYFNVDKIHASPDVNIVHDILSKALLANGMTVDVMGFKYPAGALHAPVMDVIDEMANTLRSGTMLQRDDFVSLTQDYLKGAMLARKAPSLSDEAMAWLLEYDSGYRTHVVLNSAPTMKAVIHDLYDMTLKGEQISRTSFHVPDNPSIKKGVQQQRTGLKPERVFDNVLGLDDFDAGKCLQELRKITQVEAAIAAPKESCEIVVPYVIGGLRKQGITDIRVRAMAIYLRPGDSMPNTHFAVVGRMGKNEYVVDVTAGQFQLRYEELNAPIILPEPLWSQKYRNIVSKSLIIYGDYLTINAANIYFGASSKYLSWGPEYKVPDTIVLRRPPWYFPDVVRSISPKKKRWVTSVDAHSEPDLVVTKHYRMTTMQEKTTELQKAMNEATGMSRVYGTWSAAITLSTEQDNPEIETNGTTVSSADSSSEEAIVTVIKVPGEPVSSIMKITEKAQFAVYRQAIEQYLDVYPDAAAMIAKKLQSVGVYHQKINEDNLLFDWEFGLNLINFETAEIIFDNETISDAKVTEMMTSINSVITRMRGKFFTLQSTISPVTMDGSASSFRKISSLIDGIEKTLVLVWYRNEAVVEKVEALKSEIEEVLNANTITPAQANTLSGRIGGIRVASVDNYVLALEEQKKRYTERPISIFTEFNQLRLNNVQKDLNVANSVYNIMFGLGDKLNRVFFERGRKQHNYVNEISSAIDDVEKALTSVWYRNEDILQKVKILQAETLYALNSAAITSTQAHSLSDRIKQMREKSVDSRVSALEAQKKRYTENPLSGDGDNQQRRLQNVQSEIDVAKSVYKTLHDLGGKLTRL